MVADIPENPAGSLTPADREAHDWILRFASGRANSADLAAFKRWSASDPKHVEAFARACRLWETIAPASEFLQHAREFDVPVRRARIGRRAFMGGALAASAAGVTYLAINPPLGLWPSLSEFAADYRTAPGEQRSIALAGGVSANLNTRTSIALRKAADGAERIELLSGEAAITTRPDTRRAFEVIAGGGHVAAVDAAFNIRYEASLVCTTCISGEVEVVKGGHAPRLHAGEQISYPSSGSGIGPVTAVDIAVVTNWKDGILAFQSTPLIEAVAEINRYRSGRIIVTNASLGRRLFNARFRIANIDGVVAQIQQVFGASVTALPGGIVLLG